MKEENSGHSFTEGMDEETRKDEPTAFVPREDYEAIQTYFINELEKLRNYSDKEIQSLHDQLKQKRTLEDNQLIGDVMEENEKLRDQLKQREEEKKEIYRFWEDAHARTECTLKDEIKELKEALSSLIPIVEIVVNGLMINNKLIESVTMNSTLDKAKKLL